MEKLKLSSRNEEQIRKIREAIVTPRTYDVLTEREKRVLTLRFGLNDLWRVSYTLEEIGTELGITRERVRQIEAKALRKVNCPLKLKSEERREEKDSRMLDRVLSGIHNG